MLNKEKKMSNGCDGLISRFLIAAPQSIRISLEDLQSIPSSSFRLEHLLKGIYGINKNLKTLNNGTEQKLTLKEQ